MAGASLMMILGLGPGSGGFSEFAACTLWSLGHSRDSDPEPTVDVEKIRPLPRSKPRMADDDADRRPSCLFGHSHVIKYIKQEAVVNGLDRFEATLAGSRPPGRRRSRVLASIPLPETYWVTQKLMGRTDSSTHALEVGAWSRANPIPNWRWSARGA